MRASAGTTMDRFRPAPYQFRSSRRTVLFACVLMVVLAPVGIAEPEESPSEESPP